jgi:acyl-CoA synthetase (AMP-forming)/AMP-acid ligase II
MAQVVVWSRFLHGVGVCISAGLPFIIEVGHIILSSDLYKIRQALALLEHNYGINHTEYVTRIFNDYICHYNKFLFLGK